MRARRSHRRQATRANQRRQSSRPKRAINRARNLLPRPCVNRATQSHAPTFRRRRRVLEPQVRKYSGLVDVNGDLFGAALGGDVLSAYQLRAPVVAGKADQVLGYERDSPPGAFLPWRVGRRVDHDLADYSPARMVRIAARNEKARQRLGDTHCRRLGRVAVEMS